MCVINPMKLRTLAHLEFLLPCSVSFLSHSLLFPELTLQGRRDQAASCHSVAPWSAFLLIYLLFVSSLSIIRDQS